MLPDEAFWDSSNWATASISWALHASSSRANCSFLSTRTCAYIDPSNSCPNYSKSQGLLLYILIKISYPYVFGILVCRLGKPASSSSDICVRRTEGTKRLFEKDVVPEHGPPAPVIHGALHFGVRGRTHIRILRWGAMRCWPRVRLRPRSRFWNPTSGGVIGGVSGYSPVIPLPARHKGRCHISNSIIAGQVITLPLQRCVNPHRLPLEPARSGRPWLMSP